MHLQHGIDIIRVQPGVVEDGKHHSVGPVESMRPEEDGDFSRRPRWEDG